MTLPLIQQPSRPPTYSVSPSLAVGAYDNTSALKELTVPRMRHIGKHIITVQTIQGADREARLPRHLGSMYTEQRTGQVPFT